MKTCRNQIYLICHRPLFSEFPCSGNKSAGIPFLLPAAPCPGIMSLHCSPRCFGLISYLLKKFLVIARGKTKINLESKCREWQEHCTPCGEMWQEMGSGMHTDCPHRAGKAHTQKGTVQVRPPSLELGHSAVNCPQNVCRVDARCAATRGLFYRPAPVCPSICSCEHNFWCHQQPQVPNPTLAPAFPCAGNQKNINGGPSSAEDQSDTQ